MSDRGFGPSRKPLAALSDAELRAEVDRRRLRRGIAGAGTGMNTGERAGAGASVAKHYASLELTPGAPLADVERAYERLRAKYEPFAQSPDSERSSAAASLLRGLQRAYDELRAALRK